MPQRVAALAHPFLRDRELLVPQHPREKRGALGARGVRQHRQLFLAREVGVEKLGVRHAQHALQPARDLFQRIGDDDAVLIQLGVVQSPFHAEGVATQPELQLHAHGRTGLGAQVANGILVAARRLVAVDRPGDGFEQRRLA